MAVYNNRYYPDTNLITWQDLADDAITWGDSTQDWISFSANVTGVGGSWSYTTTATDLASSKWFYPTTTVAWDDTQPVTIQYEYSTDGSTYTTANAEPMFGRYVRTKITTDGQYLESISTAINTEPKVETYFNVNTAALSGNIDSRTFTTPGFSKIQSVVITPATTETKVIQGQLLADNTSNISIRVVDVDTWSRVSTDANVNIVLTGFPTLTANSTTGTVTVTP